jgi:hypothetical protein
VPKSTGVVSTFDEKAHRRMKVPETPVSLIQRLLAHFWDFGGMPAKP